MIDDDDNEGGRPGWAGVCRVDTLASISRTVGIGTSCVE